MKAPPSSSDAFNIVLVGAWNPAIFSPEWAKANIALNKEQEVILAIPMQFTLPPRLTVDDINIYPASHSLVLDSNTFNDAGIAACVSKFHSVASLLPHTPVSAVGVNFRYIGDIGESAVLTELFSFPDAANINAETYPLTEASIKRCYALADGAFLYLSITSLPGQVLIEFNFHRNVSALSEAINLVTLEKVKSYHQQALSFLDDAYDITLDY